MISLSDGRLAIVMAAAASLPLSAQFMMWQRERFRGF
jgi:hypothetical protein